MLIAILIIGVAVLIGVAALLVMVAALRLDFSGQVEMAKEMNEADREILLGVDRIEAAIGTVKPEKKER